MSAPEGPTAYTTNRCEHRHRSIEAAVRCVLEGGGDQGWHVLRADGTGLTRDEERQVGEQVSRYWRSGRPGKASKRVSAADPPVATSRVLAARRELGFLDGEVAIESDDDFEMTEEEFLGGA